MFDILAPLLEPVALTRGQVLPTDRHVHFIQRGMVSLMNTTGDGHTVGIATVGPEGMDDAFAALGVGMLPLETVVTIPGSAVRVPRQALLAVLQAHPIARAIIDHHARWRVGQMAQIATCNVLHALDQRCARVLLTAHDAAMTDSFPMTQELIASILGVQRSSVALAMAAERQAGVIEYRAGTVTVLNRTRLEGMTCECHALIRTRLAAALAGIDRQRDAA